MPGYSGMRNLRLSMTEKSSFSSLFSSGIRLMSSKPCPNLWSRISLRLLILCVSPICWNRKWTNLRVRVAANSLILSRHVFKDDLLMKKDVGSSAVSE